MQDNGFQVAGWQVDPPTCQISLRNQTVKLEPKVMELLVFMARHPNEVLSRDELLDNVWAGMVVGYEALTNAIIKLRKAFSDDARNPRVIETFPKKGYRLIAEVSMVSASQPDPGNDKLNGPLLKKGSRAKLIVAVASLAIVSVIVAVRLSVDAPVDSNPAQQRYPLELPDKPSIAVLPFINTGNEAEHTYFSDGMTDDIITDLSRLPGLFVISRNSTFRYRGRAVDARQVASDLGVRYILEGSVRRSGNRVRINAQLIDGNSGVQLWAERYDGNLQDVFQLQDQITARITSALAMQLSETEQLEVASLETSNAEAYDEFLKGWEHQWRFSRGDFEQAEIHFRKALQLDPDYGRAHAALALIYWRAWEQKLHENVGGAVFAGWSRARRELQPVMNASLPLVYKIRSEMELYNRNYDEAIVEARGAIQSNPNDATGYLALAEVLSFAGRSDEAIDSAKKAMRLDPNFPAPYLSVMGRAQFDQGRYQEAVATLDRAMMVNPEDRHAVIALIAALGKVNQSERARVLIDRFNSIQERENMRPLTIDWLKNRWPYQNRDDRDKLIGGLRQAGVPEW